MIRVNSYDDIPTLIESITYGPHIIDFNTDLKGSFNSVNFDQFYDDLAIAERNRIPLVFVHGNVLNHIPDSLVISYRIQYISTFGDLPDDYIVYAYKDVYAVSVLNIKYTFGFRSYDTGAALNTFYYSRSLVGDHFQLISLPDELIDDPLYYTPVEFNDGFDFVSSFGSSVLISAPKISNIINLDLFGYSLWSILTGPAFVWVLGFIAVKEFIL